MGCIEPEVLILDRKGDSRARVRAIAGREGCVQYFSAVNKIRTTHSSFAYDRLGARVGARVGARAREGKSYLSGSRPRSGSKLTLDPS